MDNTEFDLIVAVESLKLRVTCIEEVLTNFVGVYRGPDGVLRYGKQDIPANIPESEIV